jgi:secreted PhoX family phosphatase
MRYTILGILALGCLTACADQSTDQETTETSGTHSDTVVVEEVEVDLTVPLDSLFTEVDSSFTHKTLLVPEGLTVQILFREKLDTVVRADGMKAPAKGSHDMLTFIPDENNINKGWLYVSHETKYKDEILGDGGGATMFQVEKDSTGNWNRIGDFRHVDFTGVRNTQRNCGGQLGPNGMIYTCEESQPMGNGALTKKGKGHTNTEKVGNLEYWQNFGYVVEVDPTTFKATQKMISWGRFYHEDVEFMDDQKTIYLSDDHQPGVFFKFVADQAGNYNEGQLFAFRRADNDGEAGSWIAMPRDTASLLKIRDVAIDSGATLFMRHEWFERVGNKIYITETGHDEEDWGEYIERGANVASALLPYMEGTVAHDVHGRLLVFDTETNQMSTHLEGGFNSDSSKVFSNPDNITKVTFGGKDYLLFCEDLNAADKGRIPAYAYNQGKYYTEMFLLDLSIENPTIDDLFRFAVGPNRAELTGAMMSPDKSTLFFNVMHPIYSNGAPYDRSVTVAVSGWEVK